MPWLPCHGWGELPRLAEGQSALHRAMGAIASLPGVLGEQTQNREGAESGGGRMHFWPTQTGHTDLSLLHVWSQQHLATPRRLTNLKSPNWS